MRIFLRFSLLQCLLLLSHLSLAHNYLAHNYLKVIDYLSLIYHPTVNLSPQPEGNFQVVFPIPLPKWQPQNRENRSQCPTDMGDRWDILVIDG